ncbi:RIP metalloprotease RseP [Bartonella sp. DGB2]|uniref:RIP metalloprotease RseP n=1 Tax=Bartonella sp. DGB2 TaxID=3388426 RepID=UPI00398FB283
MDFGPFFLDSILIFLRVLSVVGLILFIVFIHEMGHYLVGRWCGIGALTFSIGFGPQLWGRRDKRGTLWRIAAIPLGGYVKFVGHEEPVDSVQAMGIERSAFHAASPWARAATVFAGPLFNFLFALVLLSFFFTQMGKVVLAPVVGSVVSDSVAAQAGIMPGDRFVSMDGEMVKDFQSLAFYIASHAGESIDFKLQRNGYPLDVTLIPVVVNRVDRFGNRMKVGFIGIEMPMDQAHPSRLDPAYREHVDLSLLSGIKEGAGEVWSFLQQTIRFFGRLINGREDRCQLSGPTKTVGLAWQVSELGFFSLLRLAAFLSIGIGFVNLLPIPPLDGGHLLFYCFEGVFRRPVPLFVQNIIFRIGAILVIGFMIFSFFNDYSCG